MTLALAVPRSVEHFPLGFICVCVCVSGLLASICRVSLLLCDDAHNADCDVVSVHVAGIHSGLLGLPVSPA